MRCRIISGTWKGKTLAAPMDLPVRPTTDRAKEGLFNWLQHKVDWPEIEFLDLFAGIGNLSFEMLSRGAAHGVVVDRHPGCISFIRQTARQLDCTDRIKPVRVDTERFLKICDRQFHLILADPPYAYEDYPGLVREILGRSLLRPGGYLIIEHEAHVTCGPHPLWIEDREYGQVAFSIFKQD